MEAYQKLSDFVDSLTSQNSEPAIKYQTNMLANSSASGNQDNTTLSSRKKRSSGNFSHPSFFYKDLVGFFLWLS